MFHIFCVYFVAGAPTQWRCASEGFPARSGDGALHERRPRHAASQLTRHTQVGRPNRELKVELLYARGNLYSVEQSPRFGTVLVISILTVASAAREDALPSCSQLDFETAATSAQNDEFKAVCIEPRNPIFSLDT